MVTPIHNILPYSSRGSDFNPPVSGGDRITNPARSIWSDLPVSTGIATLVCYAGVFGDVIGVEEMASRLGVAGQDDFYTALEVLHRRGSIILRNGFAGLPPLGDKIDIKVSKIETSGRLISSRMEDIRRLGKNPLVKFVGISGSLAANNPVRDRNNHLDVDIFLITRSQCLWLYVMPMMIRSYFPKRETEPNLCISYLMDESNLGVTNKNFYTATEIRNLIPISGLADYRAFLQANSWVDYYYPGFSGAAKSTGVTSSWNLLNKSLYILFSVLRSIKRFSFGSFRKISFKTDPLSGINLNGLTAHYGGYQGLVHKNFSRLAAEWFPDLLDADFIEKMFPDELSMGIRKGEVDVFKLNASDGLRYDYSKYG